MTKRKHEIVLAHSVRSPIGVYSGTLKGVPAAELGGARLAETMEHAGLPGDDMGTAVIGRVR